MDTSIYKKEFFWISLLANAFYYTLLLFLILIGIVLCVEFVMLLGGTYEETFSSDYQTLTIANDFFVWEMNFGKMGFTVALFLFLVVGLYVQYIFKGVIDNFKKGDIFISQNLRDLKVLHYMNIYSAVISLFLMTLEEWSSTHFSYFLCFWILYKIYVIGYNIHEQKQRLEEESKLTI